MEGAVEERFYPNETGGYEFNQEQIQILMKVETHNHPTAISPVSGPLQVQVVRFAMKVPLAVALSPKAGLAFRCRILGFLVILCHGKTN